MAKKIVDQEYEKLDSAGSTQYSEKLISFIQNCLIYEEKLRPDINNIIQNVSTQIIQQLDKTKINEIHLNDEVIQLTRKMNNLRKDENTIKNPLLKIETENLNRVEEDPIQKSLEII